MLVVEVDGANVVEVAVEGEEASSGLVAVSVEQGLARLMERERAREGHRDVLPNLDLVVVSTTAEERLGRVEGDASYGTCGRRSSAPV